MADTREFYLVCNDGTIFGSDPSTIYKYLDMSDEGDLNDKASTVIYNFKNQFRVIDDYEIQITLTFNNRAERELFAMTNIDNIWAFGATGKIDKSVIYTKRAMVAGFEFLDNDYTNAIQSILTLKVSGQWQSDLVKYTVPSPDDNGDGTKKYYAGELYTTAKNSNMSTNLLSNSNFSNQSLSGWNVESGISTSFDSSGNLVLRVKTVIGNRIYPTTNNFTLTTGSTYTISFYAYVDTSSASSTVSVKAGPYQNPTSISVTGTTLTKYTGTFTVASGTSTTLSITMGTYNSGTVGDIVHITKIELKQNPTVGSNLLTNSKFSGNSLTGWALGAGLTSGFDSSGNLVLTVKNAVDNRLYNTTSQPLIAGTTYTISFYAYVDSSSTDSSVAIKAGPIQNLTSITVSGTTLTRYTGTITPVSGNSGTLSIVIGTYGSGTVGDIVHITKIKLETGSSATPWLPNTSDANYSYLCEATYQYYKADENINQYKYGSTNYSNTIQLDIEDNQFIIYFVLNEGENKVTISNDSDSVTLTHTAFNNGELVPLGSEGIDYSLDSRDTVDAFSLWKDGTLLSDDWTVDNVEDYFTLLSILDTIKESPVSIIAQGPEGATLPYTIYTYSKHDFI